MTTIPNYNTPLNMATPTLDGPQWIRRPRKRKTDVPEVEKNERYWDKRERNNISARRSRDIKRKKEDSNKEEVTYLREENAFLRGQLSMLKKRFGLPLDEVIEDTSNESGSFSSETNNNVMDFSPNPNTRTSNTTRDNIVISQQKYVSQSDVLEENSGKAQSKNIQSDLRSTRNYNQILPSQHRNSRDSYYGQYHNNATYSYNQPIFPGNDVDFMNNSHNLIATDLSVNKNRLNSTDYRHTDFRNSTQFPTGPISLSNNTPQCTISLDAAQNRGYDQVQNGNKEMARIFHRNNPDGDKRDLQSRLQELSAEVEIMKGVVFK